MTNMQYRKLPHGGENISIIGLGMGSIHESSEAEIEKTVNLAIERGVNYFDMVASEGKPYECYAHALAGRREHVYLQMHFGAVYDGGRYGWTRDLSKIRRTFQGQLKTLGTDYADIGFVHCVDELDDYREILSDGIWDYMKGLKESGVIRHLGLSSHDPEMVRRFLETGCIDMVMFSINPAYDYSTGTYGIGSMADRRELYRECEKEGVGISVMKPFGGGQLLHAATSPFKQALTKTQCLQYALDRPAVLTVLPGVRSRSDLEEVLTYLEASPEERDYAAISAFTPQNADGICVYCNHCQPCPMGLNVGLINKYYDLSLAGDVLAKGHYEKLSVKADACAQCGHCESRCPFHVKQEARMREIAVYFNT
ncbi:aldo/keto reductase [Anaeromassilibacillus senegalensis]|uniref:aldo/keto reductase n=1 Tax=Anaeromassilibacillus senegalensis TaxID=1673717 RepID=UPI000AF11228|nr:aldo/keto reductase [Anaeromassilibacillus senegalensis]